MEIKLMDEIKMALDENTLASPIKGTLYKSFCS